MNPSAQVVAGVLALLVSATAIAQEPAPTRPAVPVDPISGILDAFKTHEIVALGEGNHGNVQGHAFRLSLIPHGVAGPHPAEGVV